MLEGDRGPDLVIPEDETESNEIEAISLRGAEAIIIGAPATLPETVNPHVDLGSGDYHIQRSSQVAIVFAAGHSDTIRVASFHKLKLVATAAVAADRTFRTRIITRL